MRAKIGVELALPVMRAIHLLAIVLGLALILCSWTEQARVRRYAAVAEQVQTGAVQKDKQRLELLRRFNHGVTEYPSMQAVVSELDGVSGLEKGWRVVFGIGVAVCVTGVAGLVLWERLRRRLAARQGL